MSRIVTKYKLMIRNNLVIAISDEMEFEKVKRVILNPVILTVKRATVTSGKIAIKTLSKTVVAPECIGSELDDFITTVTLGFKPDAETNEFVKVETDNSVRELLTLMG